MGSPVRHKPDSKSRRKVIESDIVPAVTSDTIPIFQTSIPPNTDRHATDDTYCHYLLCSVKC